MGQKNPDKNKKKNREPENQSEEKKERKPIPLQEVDVIFGFAPSRAQASSLSGDLAAGKRWRLDMPEEEILDILQRSRVESIKLVPLGSNYTFLAVLCDPENQGKQYAAIYKPKRGEAPLWDFPNGTLYRREYGAYLVSRALDWNFIPPTIVRDGPHGVGSMQLFIDADESLNFYQFRDRYEHELKRMVVFDLICNNADRKAGHFLLGMDGHLWGIDHGLCFNSAPKLRTVVWDFGGMPLPQDIENDLLEFATDNGRVRALRDQLLELLERREVEVFFNRLERLLSEPVFPSIASRRQIPWGFF